MDAFWLCILYVFGGGVWGSTAEEQSEVHQALYSVKNDCLYSNNGEDRTFENIFLGLMGTDQEHLVHQAEKTDTKSFRKTRIVINLPQMPGDLPCAVENMWLRELSVGVITVSNCSLHTDLQAANVLNVMKLSWCVNESEEPITFEFEARKEDSPEGDNEQTTEEEPRSFTFRGAAELRQHGFSPSSQPRGTPVFEGSLSSDAIEPMSLSSQESYEPQYLNLPDPEFHSNPQNRIPFHSHHAFRIDPNNPVPPTRGRANSLRKNPRYNIPEESNSSSDSDSSADTSSDLDYFPATSRSREPAFRGGSNRSEPLAYTAELPHVTPRSQTLQELEAAHQEAPRDRSRTVTSDDLAGEIDEDSSFDSSDTSSSYPDSSEEEDLYEKNVLDMTSDILADSPQFIAPSTYPDLAWHLSAKHFGANFRLAWNYTTAGQGIQDDQPDNTIGVIDGSFFQEHDSLTDAWYANKNEICDNGIDDDLNGYIDDCQGWNFGNGTNILMLDKPTNPISMWHGTAIAGAMVRMGESKLGAAGACPGCRILPATSTLNTPEVLEAINYMSHQGVRVINLSWGGHFSYVLRDAIRSTPHILYVVAAGNRHCDMDHDLRCSYRAWPGAGGRFYDNILTVGSYGPNFQMSPFSNYGQKSVHVFAPGEFITTVNRNEQSVFGAVKGTSFAGPLVASLAQMMLYERPNLTPLELRRTIMRSCRPLRTLADKCECGGVIDAGAAVSKIRERYIDGPPFIAREGRI